MVALLGGPSWPEVDSALARGDLPGAMQVAQQAADVDDSERQLMVGVCLALLHRPDEAEATLLESFHGFGRARPARAAVAAVFLGRFHYFALDAPRVANGWFVRARSLLEDQPQGLESALAALPLPGCDVADVGALHDDATKALELSRLLGEPHLEAKALAALGTAKVSLALIDEGMDLLDEAMAMVLSGEASSPFARIDVVCDLLTACSRAGDIHRADEWTRTAEARLGLDVDHGPAFLYAHCRSALGLILCDVGRWGDAEVALRLASARSTLGGPRIEGLVQGALAELWILQGRLDDAERLLVGRHDHLDACLPLANLRLARGDYAEATRVARHALHLMGDDRVRTSRLLVICVEAELAQGQTDAARAAADHLAELAAGRSLPVLTARAAYAKGRVAEADDASEDAIQAFQTGLRALANADWPLLRAELHLHLGSQLVPLDPPGAIAEARAAHLIFDRLGSPSADKSAALLASLGLQAASRPRPTDAVASLTPRESDVLELLREGLSNAEIAARLHNSVRTIEHHVSAILAKLQLRSRAEAAVYAASLDIVVARR